MMPTSNYTPGSNIASKPDCPPQSAGRRAFGIVLAALAIVLAAAPVQAQDAPEIEFDLLQQNDSLAILIDLSFLLTSSHIARLRDGIDLGIDCKTTLRRPRRFLGSVRLAETVVYGKLSYQLLTKGYQLLWHRGAAVDTVTAGSLSRLHEYMTDSVVFNVIRLDSLDSEPQYVLDLDISAISLNSINLASGEDEPSADKSALKVLFEQFLTLTDYGRETFSTSSRPFSPAEITTR